MYNDAITDWYVEEFVKEHLPVWGSIWISIRGFNSS